MPDQPTVPPPDDAPEVLDEFYGWAVSGTLRSYDFPAGPSSFIVQRQSVRKEGASPWMAEAVYQTRAAAEATARRWEQGAMRTGTVDPESGKAVVHDPQPVTVFRVVTLEDLIYEGPEALWLTIAWLATGDHEWLISTEIGDEQKTKLAAEIFRAEDGDDGP